MIALLLLFATIITLSFQQEQKFSDGIVDCSDGKSVVQFEQLQFEPPTPSRGHVFRFTVAANWSKFCLSLFSN